MSVSLAHKITKQSIVALKSVCTVGILMQVIGRYVSVILVRRWIGGFIV